MKQPIALSQVLIRAIELDLLGDGFCSNTNENSCSSTTCISVNDNDCENHGNSENDESTSAFREEPRINSEDDNTSQLTKVLWKSTQYWVHNRLVLSLDHNHHDDDFKGVLGRLHQSSSPWETWMVAGSSQKAQFPSPWGKPLQVQVICHHHGTLLGFKCMFLFAGQA